MNLYFCARGRKSFPIKRLKSNWSHRNVWAKVEASLILSSHIWRNKTCSPRVRRFCRMKLVSLRLWYRMSCMNSDEKLATSNDVNATHERAAFIRTLLVNAVETRPRLTSAQVTQAQTPQSTARGMYAACSLKSRYALCCVNLSSAAFYWKQIV